MTRTAIEAAGLRVDGVTPRHWTWGPARLPAPHNFDGAPGCPARDDGRTGCSIPIRRDTPPEATILEGPIRISPDGTRAHRAWASWQVSAADAAALVRALAVLGW